MDDKRREVLIKILKGIQESETDSFNYLVPHLLSKKAIAMNSIREDLLFAKNTIVELQDLKKSPLAPKTKRITYEASLWYSLISVYGRCFTDATHSSKSKLEANDCFPSEMKGLESTHLELMDLRHNFIAHRGDTANEQAVLILKIPKDKIGELSHFKFKSSKAFSPSNNRLINYLAVVEYLIGIVEVKIQKNVEKIHSKFLGMDIEKLKKYLIN